MSVSGFDDGFETVIPKKPTGPSLKARAIGLLSRREHSRRELARKLSPHAASPAVLEALLDELQDQNWQSDARFVQSVVNRRASRQGLQRIAQELRQHGISDQLFAEFEDELRSSEPDRAYEVWSKKFTAAPVDAKEYARQYRFMMSRGFSSDCVRRILGDLPI